MEKQKQYLASIDKIYFDRIESEKVKISKWESEIQLKEKRYVELENLLADEMGGDRGARGFGPEAKKLGDQLTRLDAEIKLVKEKNAPFILEGYNNLKKFI